MMIQPATDETREEPPARKEEEERHEEGKLIENGDASTPRAPAATGPSSSTSSEVPAATVAPHPPVCRPPTRVILQWEDFQQIELIGRGRQAVVYRALWQGRPVAIKRITTGHIKHMLHEIEIFSKLPPHPNVVEVYGAILSGGEDQGIILELCSEGALSTFLRTFNLGLKNKVKLAMDVAEGMIHLHTHDILHRDLAARNILVHKTSQGQFDAKVADFGMSREGHVYVTSNPFGAVKWMAPEALSHKESSEKSDVWSYGILLWEMLAQQSPFPEMRPEEAVNRIVRFKMKPQVPLSWPTEIRTILNACWQEDPYKRPSFPVISKLLKKFWSTLLEDHDPEEYLSYEDLACDDTSHIDAASHANNFDNALSSTDASSTCFGSEQYRESHLFDCNKIGVKQSNQTKVYDPAAPPLWPEHGGPSHRGERWQGEEEWRQRLLTDDHRYIRRSYAKGRFKGKRRPRDDSHHGAAKEIMSSNRQPKQNQSEVGLNDTDTETETDTETDTDSSSAEDSEETGESGEEERHVSRVHGASARRFTPVDEEEASEETGEEEPSQYRRHPVSLSEHALHKETDGQTSRPTIKRISNVERFDECLEHGDDGNYQPFPSAPHKSLTPPLSPTRTARSPFFVRPPQEHSLAIHALSSSPMEGHPVTQQYARQSLADEAEDYDNDETDEKEEDGEVTTSSCSSSGSSSPASSPRESNPQQYRNLQSFVAVMRGRRDQIPALDVSADGEDFLETILGFLSSPFISMWDNFH